MGARGRQRDVPANAGQSRLPIHRQELRHAYRNPRRNCSAKPRLRPGLPQGAMTSHFPSPAAARRCRITWPLTLLPSSSCGRRQPTGSMRLAGRPSVPLRGMSDLAAPSPAIMKASSGHLPLAMTKTRALRPLVVRVWADTNRVRRKLLYQGARPALAGRVSCFLNGVGCDNELWPSSADEFWPTSRCMTGWPGPRPRPAGQRRSSGLPVTLCLAFAGP